MNRYKDTLIKDKTLPPHNFITLELVRRKFISSESDFDLYLYDALFEELLLRYEFKTIIIATNYIVTKMKQHNFCVKMGIGLKVYLHILLPLLDLNLKKLSGELYINWLEDDYS